ncbi:hypothetical protein pdam_00004036 [Pocillopora damicornis]|uniref:Uncharacterized protein n=1 Tax=Pocillopora damicornis TaxID=46731 RepID=A0A3M6UBX1_POCDA|nr:hypothetical protein pdam_00004036 [Pocillopora damicornis]
MVLLETKREFLKVTKRPVRLWGQSKHGGEQQFLAERLLTTTIAAPISPERPHYVALRTVSVVLKNGGRRYRRMVVNALLDDANRKTYINGNVAAVLGFEETVQQITANVLNGGEDSFQTTPVEFDPESVNGKTNARI